MAPQIEAENLTKVFRIPAKAPGLAGAAAHLFRPRYNYRIAVDSIRLSIEEGESVAYVGPNGAGKSTTVKMLTGILVPTRGKVCVRGLFPHQKRAENAKHIGVEVFYDGQWEIWRLINRGEFDRLLIRPLSPALQVITQISSIHGLGSVLLGSGIVLQALITLQPSWSLAKSIYLIATLFGSFLIVGGLNYISNCFFCFDQGSRMSLPLMVQNSVDFARYPRNLYAHAAQVFITWVLPFAFVAYYPTLLLLDKMNPPPLLSYLAPLAGLAVTGAAALVWRRCLVSYQGTGT